MVTINIGFIGAGKVGFSLGKYLKENNKNVVGYYSSSENSSKEASIFTKTKQYIKLEELVKDSDIILISTPDSKIKEVWENLISFPINNKIICHLSGAISSNIFSDITKYGAYGYSIHPILAISDKYNSYKNLSNACITIEGHKKHLKTLKLMFTSMGNEVFIMEEKHKVLYHQACVNVSNLIIPLINNSIKNLVNCGFKDDEAIKALYPLIKYNLENVKNKGIIKSITGPVERGDLITIKKHYDVINNDEKELYKILSKNLLEISKLKNKNKDYSSIEKFLGE